MATTRERILDTTAELFRRYGYTGTGIKQIVAEANAPFGSVYHHFPGGKEELGEEVIRRAGQMYQELVEAVIDDAPNMTRGVRDAYIGAAEVLRATDYADACPIETVALEVASTNDRLRRATADVFESWIESATERLVAEGIRRPQARELAIWFVAALEGAFVLCRAMQSTEPLEILAKRMSAAVASAPRRATR
jgi:AcrR family transcriptional regulator